MRGASYYLIALVGTSRIAMATTVYALARLRSLLRIRISLVVRLATGTKAALGLTRLPISCSTTITRTAPETTISAAALRSRMSLLGICPYLWLCLRTLSLVMTTTPAGSFCL